MKSHNWQKNQNIKKSSDQFFKHVMSYMYAKFQLSKSIFLEGDRFFLWKLGSKNAIFWQILTKLTTLKGHKILKNQNFKICCIKSLDHISISLQNQNWHFWTSRFLKKTLVKMQKNAISQKMWFFLYLLVSPSLKHP